VDGAQSWRASRAYKGSPTTPCQHDGNDVIYEFAINGRLYEALYSHVAGTPDLSSTFDTMVQSTLTFQRPT
jgi:hypothetical protein